MLYKITRPLGKKWSSLNTWESYLENFQQNEVGDIQKNYKYFKNYYENIVKTHQYSSLLKELQMEETDSLIKLPDGIDKTLSSIQSLGNLWRFVEKDSSMVVSNKDADLIINNWKQIIKMAQKENWQGISTSLDRLKDLCNRLQSQIDTGSETISISDIFDKSKSISVALSIQGTLSLIRGAVLEQEVKKFLQSQLPEKIDSVKSNFYVTGAFTVNNISIKEDLLEILDGLEIKNREGQVLYYFKNGEIYEKDRRTKVKKVSLTDYEYEQLINNSKIGLSAKTSSGQTTFHGGYNIQTLLKDAGGFKDGSIAQLYHMYQLGIGNNENLYQKYAASKIVNKILGEKNIFMINKHSIIPTYQYVEKLLKYPLSFKNKTLPARQENASLNTTFGTTDIVGPHL